MTNNQTHIMLDLETWGTKPGCDIRSIGACVFNPFSGFVTGVGAPSLPSNQFYIATDNPASDSDAAPQVPNETHGAWQWDGVDAFRKYKLTRDPKTIQWWNQQSLQAQAAFENTVELKEGLELFTDWFNNLDFNQPTEVRLWAHGSHFDIPILEAVYRACDLIVPWHYRAPRDTRTAFDLARIDDHSEFLSRYSTGTHHHALDDAICQALAVCEAYRLW